VRSGERTRSVKQLQQYSRCLYTRGNQTNENRSTDYVMCGLSHNPLMSDHGAFLLVNSGTHSELRAQAAAEGEERVQLRRGGVGGLGASVRRERVADEAACKGGFGRSGIGLAPAVRWKVPGKALLLAVEGASDGEHELPPSSGLASESPVLGSPRAAASVQSLCSCK
jgi:hypothetical protein